MSNIDLGNLTARDIGRIVTIQHRGTTITGPLTVFRIDTDWITDTSLAQSPDNVEQVPGKRTISIAVGPWSTSRLPLDARVEVYRGERRPYHETHLHAENGDCLSSYDTNINDHDEDDQ